MLDAFIDGTTRSDLKQSELIHRHTKSIPDFRYEDRDVQKGDGDSLVIDVFVVEGHLGTPDHGRERLLAGLTVHKIKQLESDSHLWVVIGWGGVGWVVDLLLGRRVGEWW